MASALADWRAIRSGSVFRPRSASQASNGPGMAPPLDRQARSSASSPASRLTTAPRITSEWPEIALVSEYSEAVALARHPFGARVNQPGFGREQASQRISHGRRKMLQYNL